MTLRYVLAAFALSVAAPAAAQKTPPIDQQVSGDAVHDIALAAVESVASPDAVILVYIENGEPTPTSLSIGAGVRYRPATGGPVLIHSQRLADLAEIVGAEVERSRKKGATWKAMRIVIAKGRFDATLDYADTFDTRKSFDERLDAVTAEVFPGIPVEPYRAPGG